jgi:hypothetical protein
VNRAERRHQERRIKARWLRRLLHLRFLGDWLEEWARKRAPRFAHHNKCDCGMCADHAQYLRHRDVKLARREERRVVHEGEEE